MQSRPGYRDALYTKIKETKQKDIKEKLTNYKRKRKNEKRKKATKRTRKEKEVLNVITK